MLSAINNRRFDPNQPVHDYLELNVFNNDLRTSKKQNFPLVFTINRNSPFLMCPNNYFASIVKFNIDTISLPVFIPLVKLGQSDPNKLLYVITMKNSAGLIASENVTYIPNDTTLSVGVPLTIQDLTNEYYYVQTLTDWANMLNATLASLCTTLTITDPPFFYFDVSSSLFKLYVPNSYTTESIYIDHQLYSLLATFPFKYELIPTTTTYGYKFEYFNNNYINQQTLNSVLYNVMTQEISTVNIYNPIKGIVFNVYNLPVLNSNVAPAYIFGSDANTLNQKTTTDNISPIISTFSIGVSDLKSSYKNNISYLPTGEYRLFDLIGSQPLYSITIKCLWKDAFGGLHDFILSPACAGDLYLLFRRRDYNSLSLEL